VRWCGLSEEERPKPEERLKALATRTAKALAKLLGREVKEEEGT